MPGTKVNSQVACGSELRRSYPGGGISMRPLFGSSFTQMNPSTKQ